MLQHEQNIISFISVRSQTQKSVHCMTTFKWKFLKWKIYETEYRSQAAWGYGWMWKLLGNGHKGTLLGDKINIYN